jgi:hypothetical protein
VAPTLVGGIHRVALDLLGASLHYPDENTLAGGATAAEAGIPVVFATHEVFREAHRALDVQLAFSDAEALTGHGA